MKARNTLFLTLIFTSAFILFGAPSVNASTPVQMCSIAQGAGNQLSYTCTFSSPNLAGDVLILPEVATLASVTDSQGNTWQQGVSTSHLGFWYALNVRGGSNTVTLNLVTSGACTAIVAEYPSAAGIQVAAISNGSGTAATSPSLNASSGDTVIGFGVNWTSGGVTPTAGAGFAMERQINLFLEDLTASAAGSIASSATWSSAVNWYQGIAILTFSAPISVSVSPTSASVPIGTTKNFTATTNDTAGVTWTVTAGSTTPSSTASGAPTTYTAPSTPGSATITATSVTDHSKSASAAINVPHQVAFSWQDTTVGATFNVYRGTGPTCTMAQIASGLTTTSYTDTTITLGSNYCYKVTAVLSGVESDGPFMGIALTVQ